MRVQGNFFSALIRTITTRLPVDWVYIAVVALAFPLIALTPVFSGRLPGTNDAELHLHRLIAAAMGLHGGQLWPRWSPHLHFGFGYPLPNFYAPGVHLLGTALTLSGITPVNALLIVQALAIMLYPVGGYLWARQFGGRLGALLAAAVFTYAPFRLYELFGQGNISQLMAMGLIPWALWGLARCARTSTKINVAIAALISAALVITHHPTAFTFLPFVALYNLVVGATVQRSQRALIALGSALLLTLVLSAVYWLPALSEANNVRVREAGAGLYSISANFVSLPELLAANRQMDRAALNPVRLFNVGLAGWILPLCSLAALISVRKSLTRWQQVHLIFGALVVAGGVFLITPESTWLWQLFSPAQVIQFPWRLMGIITVAAIPAAAILPGLLPVRWQPFALGVGLIVVIGSALPAMPPINPDKAILSPVTPAASVQYEIDSGNLGAVATYEYTPIWSKERPLFDACPACYAGWQWAIRVNTQVIPPDVQITSLPSITPGRSRFQITNYAPFQLEFHQFYYPGWVITADTQAEPLPIKITDPYGLMAVDLPAGTHIITAWYDGTPTQHFADLITLSSLIISLILLRPTPTKRTKRSSHDAIREAAIREAAIREDSSQEDSSQEDSSQAYHPRTGLIITAALIVFTLSIVPITDAVRGSGTLVQPSAGTSINRVYSNSREQPLIELLAVELPAVVHTGQPATVRLYWRALRPLDAGWRVALKLQDDGRTMDYANSDHQYPGGFSTSAWPLDHYVVDTHVLTPIAGTPPGNITLNALIYNDAGVYLKVVNVTIARIRIE